MKYILFNKLLKIKIKKNKIEHKLNNFNKKKIYNNFNKISKEYVKLIKINKYFKNWLYIKNNIKITKKLLKNPEIKQIAKEELTLLYIKIKNINIKIQLSLIPKSLKDNNSCFIEIRTGTGGNEAALFVNHLFRMYNKFAEKNKWKVKIINSIHNESGGYKEIISKFYNKNTYHYLKFESGGHRVQRVPETENQGRIHTSTCMVAVIPEAPKDKIYKINNNDLRIDTFKSSGAGGQHVNTTDSAIRITHIPSGLVVECQDERSQHKNKKKALKILETRLYLVKMKKKKKKECIIKRNLLGSGERSDRIRTYNFIKGRVTDHRINLSIYKLKEIMEGNLNILLNPLIQKYKLFQIKI